MLNDRNIPALTRLKLKLQAGEMDSACGLLTGDCYVAPLLKLALAVASNDVIVKGVACRPHIWRRCNRCRRA